MHDLSGYLDHIGFEGERGTGLATLREVVLRHTRSIPFENLDALTGRQVSLEPLDVERKLLQQRRGGWCFEQNLLLGNALRALGFAVVDLASEESQATPHERFRLGRVGDERLMESQVAGEWLPMFRFDLQPQQPVDFEAANFQLVHDPASHFTQGLRVSRVTPQGRHVLRGFELAFHSLEGGTRRQTLPGVGAAMTALDEVFGIDAANVPGLAERLEILHRATGNAGAAGSDAGGPIQAGSAARS